MRAAAAGGGKSMDAIREFTALGVVSEKWITTNSAKKKEREHKAICRPPCVKFSSI